MSITAKNVGKNLGTPPTRVLTDVSIQIEKGEFVALTGRSGSGKSTLLYTLSSLDSPSEGSVTIDDIDVTKMNTSELSHLRNIKIGFVFQFHYLIAELSAIDNVLLPAKRAAQDVARRDYAISLLERFGLGQKYNRLPRQLSGGEQQRVAIARSLIMEPDYLFADEPTGSLDSVNGEAVMQILIETNRAKKTTIVLVTHDPAFAHRASRQIQLADGKVIT